MTASTNYVDRELAQHQTHTEGSETWLTMCSSRQAALQEMRARVGKQVCQSDGYAGSRLPLHLSFCLCQRSGDSRTPRSECMYVKFGAIGGNKNPASSRSSRRWHDTETHGA